MSCCLLEQVGPPPLANPPILCCLQTRTATGHVLNSMTIFFKKIKLASGRRVLWPGVYFSKRISYSGLRWHNFKHMDQEKVVLPPWTWISYIPFCGQLVPVDNVHLLTSRFNNGGNCRPPSATHKWLEISSILELEIKTILAYLDFNVLTFGITRLLTIAAANDVLENACQEVLWKAH